MLLLPPPVCRLHNNENSSLGLKFCRVEQKGFPLNLSSVIIFFKDVSVFEIMSAPEQPFARAHFWSSSVH